MQTQFVLTLIAPHAGPALDSDTVRAARGALASIDAAPTLPVILAEGEAVDIGFGGVEADVADAALERALAGLPIDRVVQPVDGRRKRLLLADMDATMVEGETLDELAEFAGLKERVSAITQRAMNGELDFRAALRERVGMLAGLPVSTLEATWERTRLMPGGRELVATMRASGATTALVSGGFGFFTSRVRERLGFDLDFGNELEIEDGVLTGRVVEPILDKDTKLATLQNLAAARGLALSATLAVGDGANDLPMLLAAGLGVAYRAKPTVAASARARIEHADLRGLLWAQGYRASELAK